MMNVFTVMSVSDDDDRDGSSPAGIFDGYNNENVVIFDNDNDESVVTHWDQGSLNSKPGSQTQLG